MICDFMDGLFKTQACKKRDESLYKKVPFSTQREVLKKYEINLQTPEEHTWITFMMTLIFMGTAIKEKEARKLLEDDKTLLSQALLQDNKALSDIRSGNSLFSFIEFVFKENGLSSRHIEGEVGELQKGIEQAITGGDHLILNFPNAHESQRHVIYFGRKKENKSQCQFFDSQLQGGQKEGACEPLLKEFLIHLNENYDAKGKSFGISIGH